jgi:hypothetical protein
MVSRRNRRANYIPLIIEPHPEGYDGYPFITLIQYRNKHNLTIVDNADDKIISAYVLDLCSPVGIDEELVISLATDWYDDKEAKYPLSIEFSRRGIAGKMAKINRNFTIDYVTRVIGPLPKFNMTEIKSIRRRKKKPVPRGIELKRKFVNF